MSTLRVSSVRNASSATGGLDIAADGVVSGALPSPNRNLLYNGAMQVAQRGTSSTGITSGGYYTADRWSHGLSGLGTWTQDIQNDAPTGSGFRRSFRALCTTADAAPAASDFLYITQALEGQDCQRIRKGTSSAQKLTVSFWVKSNVTGTYIVTLEDNDNSRYISASYSISASATWEKKTITFAADTTGALDNDTASSLKLGFGLGAGSNFTGGTLDSTWHTGTSNLWTGQTNLAAATNNYWQITGVQLEVGDTATPFEFKSFGQELAECQRYYVQWGGGGVNEVYGHGIAESTTAVTIPIPLPVQMRVAPTAIVHSGTELSLPGTSDYAISSLTLSTAESGAKTVSVGVTSSGLTQNRTYYFRSNNSTAAYFGVSAEL